MTTIPDDGRVIEYNPTMPQVSSNGVKATSLPCPHDEEHFEILIDPNVQEADPIVWCRQCGSLRVNRPHNAWLTPTAPVGTIYSPPLAPGIAALIAANQGIFLDVGCSDHKSQGSIGMDIRAVEGVDIVHDLESFPWPLPDGCAKRILCSHLIEHIKPWLTVKFIDECWRVMQENGQLMIATPYAGSPRFWQDPTHVHGWMEATPLYFTPGHPLYDVYRPKPWKLELNEWASVGDLSVILAKLPEGPSA